MLLIGDYESGKAGELLWIKADAVVPAGKFACQEPPLAGKIRCKTGAVIGAKAVTTGTVHFVESHPRLVRRYLRCRWRRWGHCRRAMLMINLYSDGNKYSFHNLTFDLQIDAAFNISRSAVKKFC